jgi:hypothetical protein
MHRLMRMVTLIVVVALANVAGFGDGLRAQAGKSKPLDIYFVDVEGGQATLIVSPSCWWTPAGRASRAATRIALPPPPRRRA